MATTFPIPARTSVPPRSLRAILRRDRVASAIIREWRTLTDGARTLVACSGGADSTALALVLGAEAPDLIALAYIQHDIRPEASTEAEINHVRECARRLGVECVVRSVPTPAGNTEGGARRARYDALRSLADDRACPYVATAHHADDQLETLLLAIGRGAGLRGMSGIRRQRPLGESAIQLIRPMLHTSHREAERLCQLADSNWCEDATNKDRSIRRNAVRASIAPELTRIMPHMPQKAADAATLLHDAAEVIDDAARAIFGDQFGWPRATLQSARRIVVGAGLRMAYARLTHCDGLDQLSKRKVDAALDAIFDSDTHTRCFRWPSGVNVMVSAGLVHMQRGNEA